MRKRKWKWNSAHRLGRARQDIISLKKHQAGRRISIWGRCNLEDEAGVACYLETVYKGLASFQIFAIIVVNYVIGVFRGRVCI